VPIHTLPIHHQEACAHYKLKQYFTTSLLTHQEACGDPYTMDSPQKGMCPLGI